ncbi:MAG: glycosyltransferase family 39 protein [Bacteroidetes bacterium]|nr:glycosyltransferase family 39 protein [Bacteroidota bacterium]
MKSRKSIFSRFFSDTYFLSLLFLIAGFIIFKIPDLHLPYYWDESWVYGHGSRLMCASGPGILPGALPVDVSRGHPLLFYFLTSVWLKIFGNTIFASHLFSLFISVLLVLAVYKLCRTFFSARVAFFASTILLFQSIFLAQSCAVLPEVMLALWIILSILAFYSEKKTGYVIFATFMLFTKETGLVALLTLFLNELLFDWFVNRGEVEKFPRWSKPFRNFRKYLLIIVPVFIASVHFIIQKKMYGWFFFPEHMNYISFKWADFARKFRGAFLFTCIYYGRNVLFFGGIACSIFAVIRRMKNRIAVQSILQNKILSFFGLFLVIFFSFSSLNFYLDRYMMVGVVALIIPCAYFMDAALSKRILKWTAVAGLVSTFIYYDATERTNSDVNLGYENAVVAYKKCVDYCIDKKFRNKIIFTNYLMEYALGDTLSGYLDGKERFPNVTSHFDETTELCIFSNLETTPLSDSVKKNVPMSELEKFETEKAKLSVCRPVK